MYTNAVYFEIYIVEWSHSAALLIVKTKTRGNRGGERKVSYSWASACSSSCCYCSSFVYEMRQVTAAATRGKEQMLMQRVTLLYIYVYVCVCVCVYGKWQCNRNRLAESLGQVTRFCGWLALGLFCNLYARVDVVSVFPVILVLLVVLVVVVALAAACL